MNVNPDLLRTLTHQMTTRYHKIPIHSSGLPVRAVVLSHVVTALAFYYAGGGGAKSSLSSVLGSTFVFLKNFHPS